MFERMGCRRVEETLKKSEENRGCSEGVIDLQIVSLEMLTALSRGSDACRKQGLSVFHRGIKLI